MFRGIAEFAVKGRWQAATMAALLSLAAAFLPPLNYLSSGVIALTTLRMGPREGSSVLLATLLTFGLLSGLVLGQMWVVGLLLLSSWLPTFLATLALGYTRSLTLAILAATGMGGLVIILMHVFVPDLNAFWSTLITPVIEAFSQQKNWPYDAQTTTNMTSNLAGMMTGLVAAGISFNAIVGVVIGRAWQAQLFNPGAFGNEFRQMRLGKPLALLTAGLMGIALTPMTHISLLMDGLPVLLLAFTVQGIAIVHAWVNDKQKSKAWLITMYILLVFLSAQMVTILATLGVLEQWFNFRKYSKAE
jgi:hypothetical protein